MISRLGRLAFAVFVCAGAALVFAGQSGQRDSATTPLATAQGEIRGTVMSDEATPVPVRRAIVTVSGAGLASARSVLTDDSGRFSLLRLPAGRFSVTVKKAAYLPAAYGALKPGRQGTEIQLAAGQRLAIGIAMSHGGVITGTLRDAAGVPLSYQSVSLYDTRTPAGTAMVDPTLTDDRGVFRFFGLMPGEYIVGATIDVFSSGTTGSRSEQDTDALFQELARRQTSGGVIAGNAKPAPLPAAQSMGLSPVYYPGVINFADAAHVRLGPGEERAGMDFSIVPVAVSTISGTITGDTGSFSGVQLSLATAGPRNGILPISMLIGQAANRDGTFRFTNVAPGPLRITARARRTPPEGAAPSDPQRPVVFEPIQTQPSTTNDMLYGVLDVDVHGDQAGLSIVLQPGAVLSGRLAFDAARAALPGDLTKFAITLNQVQGGTVTGAGGAFFLAPSIGNVPRVPAKADGTFEVLNIGPTAYALGCFLPADLAAVWTMRTAMLNGRDLLDGPIEFLPNQRLAGVVLTLSDKRTALSGVLQTAAGQPAPGYFVVAFPADRAQRRAGARRLRSTRPSTDGRYTFGDLPPGDYLVAALTDLDPADLQDPAFLDEIAPAGVAVKIGEGEQKTLNLSMKSGNR